MDSKEIRNNPIPNNKEIKIIIEYRKDRDNPCVAKCTTLYTDVCLGCGRTSDEVSNWVTFSEEKKSEIWKRLYLEKIKNLNSRKIK